MNREVYFFGWSVLLILPGCKCKQGLFFNVCLPYDCLPVGGRLSVNDWVLAVFKSFYNSILINWKVNQVSNINQRSEKAYSDFAAVQPQNLWRYSRKVQINGRILTLHLACLLPNKFKQDHSNMPIQFFLRPQFLWSILTVLYIKYWKNINQQIG